MENNKDLTVHITKSDSCALFLKALNKFKSTYLDKFEKELNILQNKATDLNSNNKKDERAWQVAGARFNDYKYVYEKGNEILSELLVYIQLFRSLKITFDNKVLIDGTIPSNLMPSQVKELLGIYEIIKEISDYYLIKNK